PVCGGADDDPRGEGRRCWGYRFQGDRSSLCMRGEYAGSLPRAKNLDGFVHSLCRPCRCGVDHRSPSVVGTFGTHTTQSNGNSPRPRGVPTTYPIKDEAGAVVALHRREDFADAKGRPEKRIWWAHPDGRPSRNGEINRDLLPLYGVHELTTAPAGHVIVTEGEKARDALTERGIVAVGTVTGAGGTPCHASLRSLLGRPVLLWPDNDADGQRHMERIGAALVRLGHTDVRTITWSAAPPKGDAFDFFQSGGTNAQLADLITAAQPVSLHGAHESPGGQQPAPALIVLASELTAPVVSYIVE